MKQPRSKSKFTIGLDLGDRRHRFCVLDKLGEVVSEGSLPNERSALTQLAQHYRFALVVMEAGCHSPWVSRFLEDEGCRVLVANPRKLRAIYQDERKSDRRDAQMLARIGRLDPALLYPVRHGSAEAQQDLLRIKLRDSLVRARVGLINSVRFTLKSLGYNMPNPSSARFHKVVMATLPEPVCQMIAPSVQALAELSTRIKALDLEISALARAKYPQSAQLQQIPGLDRSRRSILCSRSRTPIVLPMCATSAPMPACVRDAIKAARAIHNCAFPNGAMPTCAACS